jgi:hypothetical protein
MQNNAATAAADKNLIMFLVSRKKDQAKEA